MRADRLLSILLLLQSQQRMTARELASRLEVSERTILRDMDALSSAGIPVMAERGTRGGWSLLEDYQSNLTGLNRDEIQSLFLTRPPRLLADLGLRQSAESALIKILAALPSMYRRDAEFVRQRIHIDGAGWRQATENLAFLAVVQEAIWRERKLMLTYQRGDNTLVERTVHPLGLVAKSHSWYVVADVDGDYRTYRISRIRAATISDEPSIWPPDFDLAAYWEKSMTTFQANLPCYPVVLRVAPGFLERMRWSARAVKVRQIDPAPSDTDGWRQVHIQFETDWEACEYVLGFAADVEVLDPADLRARVIAAAQAVLDRYLVAHASSAEGPCRRYGGT